MCPFGPKVCGGGREEPYIEFYQALYDEIYSPEDAKLQNIMIFLNRKNKILRDSMLFLNRDTD